MSAANEACCYTRPLCSRLREDGVQSTRQSHLPCLFVWQQRRGIKLGRVGDASEVVKKGAAEDSVLGDGLKQLMLAAKLP